MAVKKEDTQLKYRQILNDLKEKKYQPIYFLCGNEPFYINKISEYIEQNLLDESERDFNQSIMYGADVNAAQILTECKRYPMMAERVVVIVKEAQSVKDLEKIESYCLNPSPSTVLVLCHKYTAPDGRKNFAKTVKSNTVYFETTKFYDDKLPKWISDFVQSTGYNINPIAAQLLADSLGNDLDKIENELNKIYINLPKGTEINQDIIQRYVGISKDYNIFELQKALGNRDVFKANQIINYFSANSKEHPFVPIPATLFSYFVKIMQAHKTTDKSKLPTVLGIHPFLVKEYTDAAGKFSPGKLVEIISILREYDLKGKGMNAGEASDGELMKEMIYKILH